MPLTPQQLVQLMDRIAARDRAAFAALYEATSAKLFGIIVRILLRREVAEEVLQDVYVRIWERAGDFDAARASPITWMAAIARNRALDEVRRAKPVSIEDRPDVLQIADPAAPASEQVAQSQELQRMRDCIETLERDKRDLVRLAYMDGLSREELAKRTGAPVSTVKTWLHRSLKQLRDCLDK